jgi:hypothetical protein
VAHGDSILQRINDANLPFRRLTAEDLRDYIANALVNLFEGSRIQPLGSSGIDAYEIKLSPTAQAQFSQHRSVQARGYPTRFGREGSAGVKAVFGSNPDPLKYRAIEAVPMTHPLARFCAGLIEARQSGIAPRPVTSFCVQGRSDWNIAPGLYAICVEKWSIDGIVPIDRLAFVGANLATGAMLSEDAAEQALMESLISEPPLRPLTAEEVAKTVQVVEARILAHLANRRTEFEDAEAARHFDLVDTQRALIQEHKQREIARAEKQIREHRLSGSERRMNLSYAVKGKLDKFLARMDLKLSEVSKRTLNFPAHALVGIAVLEIVGEGQ